MILRSISLRNYRQHKELDVDFTGHMIAFIGRNGAGKSNFLGAIQFALTGEQPGFNKDNLLNWEAARNGEGGYVDLSFEHNGQDCRIQRRIEKAAVTLTVGEEKFSGAKKVQEQLELMGIDKDVLRQSVFVRQTEVESVLFDDPRERELAFQKLVGLGDAAKHQKFLTDFLAALAEPKNLNDEIERQKETIASQKESLANLETRAAEMERTLAKAGDEASIMKQLNVIDSRIALIENAVSKTEFYADATEKLVQTRLSLRDAPKVEVDLQWFDDQLIEIKAEKSRAAEATKRNLKIAEELRKCKVLESRLRDIPYNVEEMAKDYNDAKAALTEAKGRKSQLMKLLADAPDGNVCPLCGSEVDHNIKEEIQSEIDDVVKLENDAKACMDKYALAPNMVVEKGQLEAALSGLRSNMNSLNEYEVVPDERAIAEKEKELTEERSKAAAANDRIRANNNRVVIAQMTVHKAKEDMDNAVAQIPGNHSLDELKTALEAMRAQREKLFSGLGTLSELKAQKAQLDGGVEQLRQFLSEAEKGLEELVRINAENQVKTKKIQVIRDVKDWFSYKNGPRVMSQAVMELLVDETNKFLNQFGAAFTVIPIEEGMGFRYVLTDGSFVPSPPPEVTQLSGGQKITLAVAFRFAVYMMFAGKLGLLSLDEPTAYLDDETIARFADLLGKIRELAANMGVQCLISTHESSLGPAFDQTILIGR